MPLDAFEARLTFTDLLRRLNASVQSAAKCAQFAIRYHVWSEDLFSCIIEELDKTTLNARINILYFLETLCESSRRVGNKDYVDMVRRDLCTVMDKVVPTMKGAMANVALARKALEHLREKDVIDEVVVTEAEKLLAERESVLSQDEYVDTSKPSFSKEEILRRMEEDRERHKRMRENIWVIPPGDTYEQEFSNAWETCSSLGEDDYEVMREEQALLLDSTTYEQNRARAL
ncbi:CTD kinase subunit gamma CTK3-domain-containing protein [Dipodascopsis tothii]|uniref:CTD kinase subunit gamma CTK3-domain-containing protein n=1 Tax=Dipodascopsis tothii TaxID=44089 RepID=UPI0034CE3691